MPFIHYDEAKTAATAWLRAWINRTASIEGGLLVCDLFGKLRLVLRMPGDTFDAAQREAHDALEKASGSWWTGEILRLATTGDSNLPVWEDAWREAQPDAETDRLRHLERHRNRTAWFVDAANPVWQAPEQGPPVIVFYSFKGGVGRSTALASFAMQRARSGDRVCVVDFDLDAPGIGTLFSKDEAGLISPWGVVDYLLERAQGGVPLADYYHRCSRLSDRGEIAVFPAGTIDAEYAQKLTRVDLEEAFPLDASPVERLVSEIRTNLDPQWILLDARSGISAPAAHLLSGLAHLHVLFGTTAVQSWQGLRRAFDRLGRQRVLAGRPQSEMLLVQAMIPPTPEAARHARDTFAEEARQELAELYYAEAPEDATDVTAAQFWDIRDLESADAPHVPATITYDQRLADYLDIAEVADPLCDSTEYQALGSRILGLFEQEPDA